jgi:hypothetical protein
MKRLLILFVCVALMIVPTFAQTETTTAPTGQVIWAVDMDVPIGTTGTFTATLQDGTTIDGIFSHTPASLTFIPISTSVDLEGDTSTTTFYTPLNLKMSLWHGDTTNDTRQIKLGYGQYSGLWNDVVVADASRSAITSFTITADNTVTTVYEYRVAEDAAKDLAGYKNQSIIDFAWSVFWDALSFLTDLFYWIKFFFIDNLALILALFLAVPMAFAAKNSRGNPERFMRQYFKTLRGFFEFIFQVWRLLTETIGTIIGWFKLV